MQQNAVTIQKYNKGTIYSASFIISLLLLTGIIGSAILAPILVPCDPDRLNLALSLQQPSVHHWLGTDKVGRDIFSRLLFGARTTLLSALAVVLISILLGVPLGLVSGYRGGWLDTLVTRIWDIILAFPALLLAFVFVAAFGRNIGNAILALGIVYIPMISRLTRSLTLVEKNKIYVEAARSLGYSEGRILFRHILPNCIPVLLGEISVDLAYAILDLAALSFLGLGVQPPTSDWGAMLEEGRAFLLTNPLMALAPGFAIVFTVIALNIMADCLQMYYNPRQRKLPCLSTIGKVAGESGV